MSTSSFLSSGIPSPASRYQPTGVWHPRTASAGTSHSHQISPSARKPSGSRGRYLHWDHHEALPGSSNLPRPSPTIRGPLPHQAGPTRHPIASNQNARPLSRSPSGFRTTSGARNEAPQILTLRPLFHPRSNPRPAPFQTRHPPHARAECSPGHRRLTCVGPSSSPIATSFFTPSSSPISAPTAPFTPPRQTVSAGVVRNRCSSANSASVSSFASPDLPEPSTPSPSPRTHRARLDRPTPPPALLLWRGIASPRAPPTLAMSVQVHAPSPVLSLRSLSPPPVPSTSARARSRSRRAESRSRPSSPRIQPAGLPTQQRPPMARPRSRSERLLRDTLRRAEEHDRMLSVHPLPSPKLPVLSLAPSPFLSPTGVLALPNNGTLPMSPESPRRHSRRNTSSSVASSSCDGCDFLYDPQESTIVIEQEDQVDDMEGWSWRGQSGSSGSAFTSGYGHSYQQTSPSQGLSRHRSLTHRDSSPRTYSDSSNKAQLVYGTPSSPTPSRVQLQRSIAVAPNPTPGQPSTQSPSISHSHSNSRTSFEGERLQGAGLITPHEAVLRARLEGVLKGAKEQERRERSSERRYREPGSGSGSGSGNSMASSRNLSAEGDLFFAANGESSVTSLSSVDSKTAAVTNPRASLSSTRAAPPSLNFQTRSPQHANAALRSPGMHHVQLGSPHSSPNGSSPLTPPPTPPFNARTAAEQCKAMDGYVSFATIEGLGVPEGDEDSEGDDGKDRGRWWQWLTIAPKAGRGRGRSESACSAVSR